MSDRLYDILSKVQRWLPFLGTFYLAISAIWGFGFGEEVNETVMAVAALLAGTLEVANYNYEKNKNAGGYIVAHAESEDEE